MTAFPQPRSSRLLSERLTTPLREIAQRRWVVLAVVGILQTLIVALSILLAAALLLGFAQGMWVPARVALAVVAWAIVIGSAAYFLRPALRRWTLSHAALHVESLQPQLQERLSSAVELGQETDARFRGSKTLVAHLIQQAETDAAAIKPDAIVRNDPILRWSLYLAPVLMAWVVIALIPATTKPALAGMYRILMPWSGTLPAILSKVVVKPGNVTVVAGDDLEITARVSLDGAKDVFAGHAQLIRRYENGQKIAAEMERTSSRNFRIPLTDLRQGFTYQVSTDRADSDWYQVIVHPRPVITSLDVHYDYPKYTGLEPKTDTDKDGAIDALVGTKVTLIVHTAEQVVTDKCRVVIDEGKPEQVTVPLTPVAGNATAYQAVIPITHTAEYKILLTNQYDLTNKDEQPRSIVARPDEVPTIVIELPETQVTVRPDDTVPVKYTATDDFGVDKIEAILQVDDHPSQTVPVKFSRKNKTNVTGPDCSLVVSKIIAQQTTSDADHITYQLKVTDNRDPNPQVSFSAKQTLKVNKNEQSYQDRVNQKLAQALTQSIQKAINKIDENRGKIEQTRDADKNKPLEDWRHKQLQEAKESLAQADKELAEAAEKAKDTAFDDVSKQVQDIADNPLKSAVEDAAQAELNADTPDERHEAAQKSAKEMAQAREALQKLIEKQEVPHAQARTEAAHELAEAAQKQREAADKMRPQQDASQDPQTQQQAMQKQQEAVQKLQQALQKSEALRDPKAEETARKLRELVQKVEELEKQQAAAIDQEEKQQAANQIQEQANSLAKQQEELNQQIAKSGDDHKQAMQQAAANPPNADQQKNIVKQLNENKLHEAHDAMKQSAAVLRQEAQQLQNLSNGNDLKPSAAQQDALNQKQQDVEKGNDRQNQANQSADALKQESTQNAVPKVDDAAVQKAEQLAQDIQKQAAQMKAQDADAQKEADAANADAQAAEKAAQKATQEPNPQQAQQDLQQAADAIRKAGAEIVQAAQENQKAAKADMLAQQKQEAQHAAEEAKAEADKQEELAKALEPQDQQLAEVRKDQQPPDQAAQQQQQLAEQTKQAQHQARELRQQAQRAKNENVAHRAEEAQAELAQAEHHEAAAAGAERAAAKAEQQAAQAQGAEQAQAAEDRAGEQLQQAAQEQQQAQEALAKAESTLRDLPQELAQGAEQGQENAEAGGEPHENGEESGQGQHHASGKQAMQQAAQGAQEAKEAQQEAQQQNPAAAQEAARALADAARAMSRGMPGSLHQGEPGQAEESGDEQAMEQGDALEQATHAARATDSKQGITAVDGAGNGAVPGAVRDIGITADDWAKLPPLVRKDLLNAAQQTGPPSYRQMIKEYYVRIARMQNNAGAVRR